MTMALTKMIEKMALAMLVGAVIGMTTLTSPATAEGCSSHKQSSQAEGEQPKKDKDAQS